MLLQCFVIVSSRNILGRRPFPNIIITKRYKIHSLTRVAALDTRCAALVSIVFQLHGTNMNYVWVEKQLINQLEQQALSSQVIPRDNWGKKLEVPLHPLSPPPLPAKKKTNKKKTN